MSTAKKKGVVKKPRTLVFEGVRTDLEDFFRRTDALECQKRSHTPFIVLTPDGRVVIEDSASGLASDYPPESHVLCQWPGQWRSDFFRFTVKEFVRRYSERKPRG